MLWTHSTNTHWHLTSVQVPKHIIKWPLKCLIVQIVPTIKHTHVRKIIMSVYAIKISVTWKKKVWSMSQWIFGNHRMWLVPGIEWADTMPSAKWPSTICLRWIRWSVLGGSEVLRSIEIPGSIIQIAPIRFMHVPNSLCKVQPPWQPQSIPVRTLSNQNMCPFVIPHSHVTNQKNCLYVISHLMTNDLSFSCYFSLTD